MIKKVLTMIVVSGIIMTTTAQEVKFGIKGGLNLASINGDDVSDDLKSRSSYHFGIVTEVPISEEFSIQPELLISGQGARDEYEGVNEDLKLNYLATPIQGKYYVSKGLSVEAGPQLGVLLSAKSEFDGKDVDIKDSVKNIDFGFNLGIGYKLDNGMAVGARYNFGLSDINDEDGLDSVKNGVFQISVGYFF